MRIRLTVSLTALAMQAALASPAAAQSADVKCLLVSNLYSKASTDAKARQVAEVAKYYYLGRIHGRMSEAQLKAQIVSMQKSVTAATSGEAMSSCARAMQTAAATIQRVALEAAPKKK